MILKEEIQKIATQKQLGMDIIEKDYVLGWVLAGIHHHIETKNSWIFKGGTCLKKCYFSTYRFSEDLDFTYQGQAHEPTEEFYRNIFVEIGQWIYSSSGIELQQEGISFEVFKNNRGSISVQGKLPYRGPIKRNYNASKLPRLKIDITLDEPLILKPVLKKIDHPYSDMLGEYENIFSYSYEELFAEKLRALIQRLRPRDLYDVVYLFNNKNVNMNLDTLKKTLQRKCDIREVPFPEIELIRGHKNIKFLESEWGVQLRHQMPDLPPFSSFFDELIKIFKWVCKDFQ